MSQLHSEPRARVVTHQPVNDTLTPKSAPLHLRNKITQQNSMQHAGSRSNEQTVVQKQHGVADQHAVDKRHLTCPNIVQALKIQLPCTKNVSVEQD